MNLLNYAKYKATKDKLQFDRETEKPYVEVSVGEQKFERRDVEIGISDGLAIDHPKFISYVGKTSLASMAKIIQGAKFFIGIDSGPTHIANAFEIPGLILLGDYKDFKNHMPYSGAYETGCAKIYHYPDGLSTEIPFETVWQMLTQLKPIPSTQLA